jgi:hypothetical protein
LIGGNTPVGKLRSVSIAAINPARLARAPAAKQRQFLVLASMS